MLVLEASHFPGTSKIMDLRKESTTVTLLGQHNSLLQSESYLMYTDTCSYHPSPKKLSSQQWILSQKTTTGHNTEINGLWGAQYVNTSTAHFLPLRLREHHRRGNRKIVRSRIPGRLPGNSFT